VYLRREFVARGWLTEASEQPDGRTILAVKGSREATVMVTSEGDTTNVDVILVPGG
jgi:hypothetical protein